MKRIFILPTILCITIINILFSQTDSLVISWNQNPEPDMLEYHLYRDVNGTNNLQKVQTIPHPQIHTVDNDMIQPGNLYSYALIAIDSAGYQSQLSEVVSVGLPQVNWTLGQIDSGVSTVVPLSSFLIDLDDNISNLQIQISNQTNISVSVSGPDLILTPTPVEFSGLANFLLRVNDPKGFWDINSISVNVIAPINNPPQITSTPTTTVVSGNQYQYQVIASDPDPGDELTYSLTTAPGFLSINDNNGLISGIPAISDTGMHNVNIRVVDSHGADDNQNYQLTVTPQNRAPVISDIPNQNIQEGQNFVNIILDNYVTDPDNSDSDISWNYSGNTELTLNIDVNRVVTITVPDSNWNGTETIVFTATDPGELSDTDEATFTVIAVNDPPQIVSTPITGATQGQLYEYQVVASDPEQGDILTFALNTAPAFLSINSNTGLIRGTPAISDTGDHSVMVRVSDQAGLFDTQSYILTVFTENAPPVLADIPNQTILEGQDFAEINLDDFVTDPDNLDTQINWSYSGNTDLQMSINSNRIATITVPNPDWYGSETITFTAVDPGGLSDDDAVTFTVTGINDPPIISLSQLIIEEDQTNAFDLKEYVSDVDNVVTDIVWEFQNYTHFQFIWEDQLDKIIRIESIDGTISEQGLFIASDPEGLSDTANVTLIYDDGSSNTPPFFVSMPSFISFDEDSSTSLNLEPLCFDSTNNYNELEWSFYPSENINYEYNSQSSILYIFAESDWYGQSSIRLRITDPDGLYDEANVNVMVQPRVDLNSIDIRMISTDVVAVDVDVDVPSTVEMSFWVSPNLISTYKTLNFEYSHNFTLANIISDTVYNYSLTLTDTSGFLKFYQGMSFNTNLSAVSLADNIRVYPNPYRPLQGHGVVVFDNLPEEMEGFAVYTPTGELVYERIIDGLPQSRMPWTVINKKGQQLASGLYIYVIKGEGGRKLKSGKIAVIR